MNIPAIKPTAAALLLAVGLSGCANIKDDQTRTKTEGTLLGAGIGAALGTGIAAIVTHGNSEAMLKGAAIGGALGGLAGHSYGSKVAAKKARYASQEAYLQDCIAELRDERARVAAANTKTRSQIASQKQELNELIALQQNNQPTREKFVSLRKSVDSSIQIASKDLQRTNTLIQDHEAALQDPTNTADLGNKADWKSELAILKAERAQLQASINSLNAIDSKAAQMVAQAR